jgi:lipopolysaccharide export system protein LptA
MRVSRDGLVCALVLVVCSVVAANAQDVKPSPAKPPPNALFQTLSLGSGKGPVRIDADSLELDYKGSLVTYKGHVEVVQGDVTLNSDRLSIRYDPSAVKQTDKPADAPVAAAAVAAPAASAPSTSAPAVANGADKIKEIVAEGNVRIRQGTRIAEGKRAVFDQAKQTVVLSDNAVLHDGPNQVAGERVIVYLQEERSVVESGSNTRVKAVLYPGNKDDAGKPTATALPIQAAGGSAASKP